MAGLPDHAGAARDQYILAAAQAGRVGLAWAPLRATYGSHEAVFKVTADAMKVDGVRVGVGAALLQQIADSLGCLLLTPRLLDLMYAQRSITVPPVTLGTVGMMDTSRMEKHSLEIDKEIVRQGGAGGGIVQSIGKPWMISNALLANPGKAENYGWHVPPDASGKSPNPWRGVTTIASVTLPGIRVIQDPGWRHGLDQADYSETVQLVDRRCTVDGEDRDLADVLQDKALAGLASHEGPLKILRQPGVPVTACPTSTMRSAAGLQRPRLRALTVAESGTEVCPLPKVGKPPLPGTPWWAWALGGTILIGASYAAYRIYEARLEGR